MKAGLIIMNTTTTTEVQQANELDFFDPIVLHYVRKTMIAESAVLGTEMRALCGEEWTADETSYAVTGGTAGASMKTVTCPLCADVYSGLPAAR